MKNYISILLMILVSAMAAGQRVDQNIKELQKRLDSLQTEYKFPGATFSVLFENGEILTLATGLADTLDKVPMKSEHRMLSGSNGKTLFIAAALELEAKGCFNLNDKISAHLKDEDWFERIPNAQDITIRMLMNHTSGIEEYYTIGDFMDKVKDHPERTFSPLETFSYVFDRDPLFPAGEGWGYADTNYLLLGYILEKTCNQNLYNYIENKIIQPLELNLTEPSTKQKFENLAVGYSGKHSPFPFHGPMVRNEELVFNPQFEWTGGGFISNSADLAVWIKEFYERTKSVQLDTLNAVPAATGKDHLYGLGAQIRPSVSYGMSYGHSGWFPGYITDAAYFPQSKLAVAVQFNTDQYQKMGKSAYDIMLHLLEALKN